MSVPLTGKKKEQAEKFYDKLITTMIRKRLPFMVGGTFAFMEYTGIERETGDIDIKIPYEDYPAILQSLSEAGYKTELAEIELNWLAKVTDPDGFYTDLIYAERNGLYKVRRKWLERAGEGHVLGHKVKLEPVEEIIRSKCYVRNRHRDDSGDVVHLILKQGKNVNWRMLMKRTEPHWELLLSTLVLFLFIYPSERKVIPRWVIKELVDKLNERVATPPTKERITRGLLLSSDYQVGVANWGFTPITELK
jgi:hypothetical protein